MLLFLGAVAVAATIAVVVVLSAPNDDPPDEARFPPYWAQLEEGETTRQQIVDRLGEPAMAEGECLFYEELTERQNYKFCFEGDTLALKAAY